MKILRTQLNVGYVIYDYIDSDVKITDHCHIIGK